MYKICIIIIDVRSVGGLRHVEAREKMAFSRTYNEVVLGFSDLKIAQDSHVLTQIDKSDSVSTLPSECCVLWFRLKCTDLMACQRTVQCIVSFTH